MNLNAKINCYGENFVMCRALYTDVMGNDEYKMLSQWDNLFRNINLTKIIICI